MVNRTKAEKDNVLRLAYAFFDSHARHNLSPTSRDWSERMARECLWALGVAGYEGRKAQKPDTPGDTIEGMAIRLVETQR